MIQNKNTEEAAIVKLGRVLDGPHKIFFVSHTVGHYAQLYRGSITISLSLFVKAGIDPHGGEPYYVEGFRPTSSGWRADERSGATVRKLTREEANWFFEVTSNQQASNGRGNGASREQQASATTNNANQQGE